MGWWPVDLDLNSNDAVGDEPEDALLTMFEQLYLVRTQQNEEMPSLQEVLDTLSCVIPVPHTHWERYWHTFGKKIKKLLSSSKVVGPLVLRICVRCFRKRWKRSILSIRGHGSGLLVFVNGVRFSLMCSRKKHAHLKGRFMWSVFCFNWCENHCFREALKRYARGLKESSRAVK